MKEKKQARGGKGERQITRNRRYHGLGTGSYENMVSTEPLLSDRNFRGTDKGGVARKKLHLVLKWDIASQTTFVNTFRPK